MKKILPIFSYGFHPVFIPILGTLCYVWLDKPLFTPVQYIILFLQVAIITILLPLLFFLLLKTFGKIDNLMLSDISQRKIPLLLHIILLSILIARSITLEFFPELYFFFLGGLISSALAFFLLFVKIKASIHMIGMSSLTVFTIGLSINNEINTISLIAFLLIMNGFVATSRLVMNAHTSKELLIGFLCGVIPQTGLLFFWL